MDDTFLNYKTPEETTSWDGRCNYWRTKYESNMFRRKRREREISPLILCGHGLSIRIDKGALVIRDGHTHFPSESQMWRFFKGALNLPPRIVIIDGSGEITFDALAWLSNQNVPLISVKWDGSSSVVMSPTGYAADPKRVQWQRDTLGSKDARLAFALRTTIAKLRASLVTLNSCIPLSPKKDRAAKVLQRSLTSLKDKMVNDIGDLQGIEGSAAAAYFDAWQAVPIRWKGLKRYPIPDDWKLFQSRSSLTTGIKPKNYNADHPINAMLNYGYAVLHSRLQIEAIANGFDPTAGIMHKHRKKNYAYVLDLMEPKRPIVDRAILSLIANETFFGRDFAIQDNGVCRLNPQLTRRVVQTVMQAL